MTSESKIVFITHYNDMNGANQSLYTLLVGLSSYYSIKVYIHNPEHKDEGLYRELKALKNVDVENIKLLSYLYFKNQYLGPLKLIYNFLSSLGSILKIVKYCKRKRVVVIYSNSSVESYGFLISKCLGIKHVWHVREFGYLDYGLRHVGGDKLKRLLLGSTTLVIAISRAIESYVRTKNCKLIYNGVVDSDKIDTVKQYNCFDNELRLGVVGLISHTKNQRIAIEAIKNLRGKGYLVSLDLWGGVGDVNYKKELDVFITQNGLESFVNFKGFEANKDNIYSSMDILIMCSPYEAFGRVTIEAMSRGIVVVGNKAGGTVELIEDNVNGLLYSGVEQLENKIVQMIENRDLYTVLSNESINSAKKFSIQTYIKSINESIKILIEE